MAGTGLLSGWPEASYSQPWLSAVVCGGRGGLVLVQLTSKKFYQPLNVQCGTADLPEGFVKG